MGLYAKMSKQLMSEKTRLASAGEIAPVCSAVSNVSLICSHLSATGRSMPLLKFISQVGYCMEIRNVTSIVGT